MEEQSTGTDTLCKWDRGICATMCETTALAVIFHIQLKKKLTKEWRKEEKQKLAKQWQHQSVSVRVCGEREGGTGTDPGFA